MPSLLFGSDALARPVGRGRFFCPQCAEERDFERVVVRRALRLFSVPILPLGRYGEFVECGECRSTFRPEVLAYRGAAPAEYHDVMKRVLAVMVVSDGTVRGSEVETVRRVFEAITGITLGRDEIRRSLDAVMESPTTVARVLAQAMGYLNDYGKEQILRACALVSSADGHVHEKEVEMMHRLGGVLRMDRDRVDALLRELAGPPM